MSRFEAKVSVAAVWPYREDVEKDIQVLRKTKNTQIAKDIAAVASYTIKTAKLMEIQKLEDKKKSEEFFERDIHKLKKQYGFDDDDPFGTGGLE